MATKRKLPVSEVLAELDYLEFHKQKGQLANGTYRVIEHDGEINFAVLGDFRGTLLFDIDWYSEAEYESARAEQASYDRLDMQMMFDDEDHEQLMDSWDEAMHRDHDEFRRVDAHDFANDDDRVDAVDIERALDNDLDANRVEPKTLGELLRESMVSGDAPIQTPMFNERPFIEDDGNGFEIEHEEDIVSDSEFEEHKSDLSQFMQTSSEQLDRSMANKPADLGDLI